MIQANELRLGNYFNYDNKIVFIAEILKDKLVTIYDGSGLEKGTTLGCLRPIPLTEEILLKCGFSRKKSDNTWAFINNEKFIIEYSFERYSFRVVTDRYNSTFLKTIKYRHQLQNLFFALTGEEIKIEL